MEPFLQPFRNHLAYFIGGQRDCGRYDDCGDDYENVFHQHLDFNFTQKDPYSKS